MAEPVRKKLKLHGCMLSGVRLKPGVPGFELRLKVKALVGDDLAVECASWLGRIERQELGVDVTVESTQYEMEALA